MKIIQIVDRNAGDFQVLLGLGDDGNVYTYSYSNGSWKPYSSKVKKTAK